MEKPNKGGGWPAIRYALKTASRAGGVVKFLRAMRTHNACKTCALGMGGQQGGMVDEAGRFPEVCKKSMQAMAADMQDRVPRSFFAKTDLNALRRMSPRDLEHLGRLADPLLAGAGDTHFRPIGWDEALKWCVEHLKRTTPDRNFFYASGRSSNEAAFLLQLFARLYGTNNVNNCSYYCHQASGVGLGDSIGSGTATIVLEDLERCDLLFLIGGNPASNHPRLMRQLMKLRRRGGSVIVINPLKETGLVEFSVPSDAGSLLTGSAIASHYIQPHIGGDIALLSGIAKRLDEIGAIETSFARSCTEGFDAFLESVRALSWSRIVEASGVDKAAIHTLAEVYAASSNTVFAWAMGITHHLHGADNVRAIVNLALMRGMVGKSGAGLLPIRGHSNVQGVGSVGVTPALKQAIFDRLENHLGIKLPTTKGLDTLACLRGAHDGAIQSGWCLGGNLYGASPDAKWAEAALVKLDSIVYMSTTLNTGHLFGRARETLILPMLARDEEPQPTTQESMFSFVRLSDGGPRRHDGPRSEVETIARIARGVLGDDGPIDWRSMLQHRTIRQAIAAVVPGYEKLDRIDETKQEFHITGRCFHQPRFATSSGRAKFHVVPLPTLGHTDAERQPNEQHESAENDKTPAAPGSPAMSKHNRLRLMTIRSEGQFNTVVYEEEDIYRHQDRRDVILMSAEDMDRLGLMIDQRVTVKSSVGRMENILVRQIPIRAGNAAMYFPEANTLVPAIADPESKTPAYKAVTISIAI